MKWFEDTFLKSIFEKQGENVGRWLSAKQTAICTQYMERQTIAYSDGFGTFTHNNYYYSWNGYNVTLFYSKKNSCGKITFTATGRKTRPARLAQKIADAERRLSAWEEDYSWAIEDGEETSSIEKHIAETKAELAERKGWL